MITTIHTFAFFSYKSGHREKKKLETRCVAEIKRSRKEGGNLPGAQRDASTHMLTHTHTYTSSVF